MTSNLGIVPILGCCIPDLGQAWEPVFMRVCAYHNVDVIPFLRKNSILSQALVCLLNKKIRAA